MRRLFYLMFFAAVMVFAGKGVYAHCQVPCGIYDDHARIASMLEDAATVEKALVEMKALSGREDLQSKNQMVRWVINKEAHAERIISTISDYFLTQRVRDDQEEYEKRLTAHHRVIVSAMKVKQNTEVKYAEELRRDIEKLVVYYPEHKH